MLSLSYLQMQLQQTTFRNIVAKEEIAHYEQFSLCHNFFNYLIVIQLFYTYVLQQICCMWEMVNSFPHANGLR